MKVIVEPGGRRDVDPDALEAAVRHTVRRGGGTLFEISLTLLDDAGITALNLRYLGHDRPTDVLAFTLGEPPDRVGDVYLGVDQAGRQADEHGIALQRELERLAVHGTLHVLGHDHPDGEERYASPMFELQERILSELAHRGSP